MIARLLSSGVACLQNKSCKYVYNLVYIRSNKLAVSQRTLPGYIIRLVHISVEDIEAKDSRNVSRIDICFTFARKFRNFLSTVVCGTIF